MNKKISYLLSLALYLLAFTTVLVSCSKDGNDEPELSSYYSLNYKDEGVHMAYFNWENSSTAPYLKLQFDEGIPQGADWFLECNESWVKIDYPRGRVNGSWETVRFSVEDNTDYDDREAHIYLNIPEGNPGSTDQAYVTLHQYGYESHLSSGRSFSFTTNRSKSETSVLTIDRMKIYDAEDIVEIVWGDGSRNIITNKDKQYYTGMSSSGDLRARDYSISHTYSTNDSFNVKIRFAPDNLGKLSFYCHVDEDQGVELVEYYDNGGKVVYTDESKDTTISYSDTNGFNVHQY